VWFELQIQVQGLCSALLLLLLLITLGEDEHQISLLTYNLI